MFDEKTRSKQQRQEAFDWLYNLVSPKYVEWVERRFDENSEAIPAFKAYIAFRIAIETARLFNNRHEFHVNTYNDIQKQLSAGVSKVITRTQNPWLQKCFQNGLKFQPGTVEFRLRQEILLDMQMSFSFLREDILGPELEALKPTAAPVWSFYNWLVIGAVLLLLSFGFIFNLASLALLLNKQFIIGLVSVGLLVLTARWLMKAIPAMWRSTQLYYHYGQVLGAKERNHLAQLHPNQLLGEQGSWLSSIFSGYKESGVNEEWVDLEQWLLINFNLHSHVEKNQVQQPASTPGRPLSWTSVTVFSGNRGNHVSAEATTEETASASKVVEL